MTTLDRVGTGRLLGERLRPHHLEEMRTLHRDPVAMATLGGLRDDEDTRRWLGVNLGHWERHGFGLWVFRDRADGRFVGRGGLRHVEVEGRDEVEVAYALVPAFWGRGLATEIACVSVATAFGPPGLGSVIAFTLPENRRSRRVMEKAGFVYEHDIVHAGLPHVLYRHTPTTPPPQQ
jgi:[ribosomal protein S5]-alanine N-acetyltransferase